MAAASVSVALGPAREEVLPALPVLLSRRSLHVWVLCVCVCVFLFGLLLSLGFFLIKKRRCVYFWQ